MQKYKMDELSKTLECFFSQTRIPVCIVDSLDGVMASFSNAKDKIWSQEIFEYILSNRNHLNLPKSVPFLSYSTDDIFAGLVICEDLYIGVGPVMSSNLSLSDISKKYAGRLSDSNLLTIYDFAHTAPKMDVVFFSNALSLLTKLVTGNLIPYTAIISQHNISSSEVSINTASDINNNHDNYSEKLNRNIDLLIDFENNLEQAVESGVHNNINRLWEVPEQFFMDNIIAVPNASSYMMVRLVTIMNRAAIKAGADERSTFVLTDKYIKRFDKTGNAHDKFNLLVDASFSYCSLVATAKSRGAFALPARKCARYIEDNLSQKITTSDLAILCGISERQIYRVFKESFNASVSEYITNKRLEKSRFLLKNTSYSVSEISASCGFFSQSYFTKEFRRKYGATPTAYKNNRL